MRFPLVFFFISLIAFIFFFGWTIQTIWLAAFFSKTTSSFDTRMGWLFIATGLCFVSMIASISIYIIHRMRLSRTQARMEAVNSR
jgi:uncharacterized membrane protein